MAKFLTYGDRLEIQNGLKEHMTFTQIGEKLGRDRTTMTEIFSFYDRTGAYLDEIHYTEGGHEIIGNGITDRLIGERKVIFRIEKNEEF